MQVVWALLGTSPACVHLHQPLALSALDEAAPVEPAAAALSQLHLCCMEATAATQQLAAINGLGCLVARAASRAQHTTAHVLLTEVWTGLQVHQVLICMWLELCISRHQCPGGAHTAWLHLCGTIKLLL